MKSLKNILSVLSNKYVIASLAFLVWLLFFDTNSIINQFRLNKALDKVVKEKEFYIYEIEKDRQTASELKSAVENLERFAREEYLMKRDDEDVYIIIEETEEQKQNRLNNNL